MKMKKLLYFLTIWVAFPFLVISLPGIADEAKAEESLYNAREELEYTSQARRDRQDERNRQIQFQQYQQQEYLQHEREMNLKSMYNQVHQNSGSLEPFDEVRLR
jgi:hypothetical protein